MKLDKETITAIVLCMAFLITWPHIAAKIWPPKPMPQKMVQTTPAHSVKPVKKESTTKPQTIQNKSETSDSAPSSVVKKTTPTVESIKKVVTAKKIKPVILENSDTKVTIDPNDGKVASVELLKITNSDLKTNVTMLTKTLSGTLMIVPVKETWNEKSTKVEKGKNGQTAKLIKTYTTKEGKEFQIITLFSLESNYVIKAECVLKNLSDTPLSLGELSVSAGGVPPVNKLSGDKVYRENHEIDYYDITKDKVIAESANPSSGFWGKLFGGGKKTNADLPVLSQKISAPAKWVGVSNKYFASILLPAAPFKDGIIAKSVFIKNAEGGKYVCAEAQGLFSPGTIAPGKEQKYLFKYYGGPKKLDALEAFDSSTTKILKLYMLGMRFIEPLSKLMLNVLVWLTHWCGSYGLSIILLTLIVKTIFWPVTHKANVSMRKMQKIQPLIKELRKKYKDNPQQMNMELMKLYKEHGVNPLGGCLPILLQMPVFFALYATLSGSIEPRHSAFLWMHDLSMPDTVAVLFGLPINPLMLMMTGTMVLQQKLTPSAADPAQQKMMMFMPLVMLVMLYSLPSGLTLYWTVSQFISIAQLVVNKKLEARAELKEKNAA